MYPAEQPFIQMRAVSHEYHPRGAAPVPALRGVDLDIRRGEFVALVGSNGSGKSTLARHLNALLLPTEGVVAVDGLDTRDRANHRRIRSTVGMVFQIPVDQIVATIAQEDVAFGPENLGVPQPELGRRVREAMERVGMWEWRERPPHMLSPGQQQRLALAGALAMQPDCLVLDEATAMLDPQGRRDLWGIVEDLRRDGGGRNAMTILFITHDMDEAARADRIVALHRGRVALDGAPSRVFADPRIAELGLSKPVVGELTDLLADRDIALQPAPSRMRELAAALLAMRA